MFKVDIKGKVACRLSGYYQVLLSTLCIVSTKIHAIFWGVDLGKNCRFIGKVRFYRAPGAKIFIGSSCTFRSSEWSNFVGVNRACFISAIKPNAKINIGSGCGLTATVIASAESITIGNNVLCGANVTIMDTDFHGIASDKRKESGITAPVYIDENVWLGLNVTVLKGSVIGKNSVIGAGSIVSGEIPPNVIAIGQPAKVIREI